ncbi:hypothetical protein Bbelb_285240 [Branchiostoma belcheri]|nr:hypothetical protein Bbelb_285240 [Branchiostoma belcheri]
MDHLCSVKAGRDKSLLCNCRDVRLKGPAGETIHLRFRQAGVWKRLSPLKMWVSPDDCTEVLEDIINSLALPPTCGETASFLLPDVCRSPMRTSPSPEVQQWAINQFYRRANSAVA